VDDGAPSPLTLDLRGPMSLVAPRLRSGQEIAAVDLEQASCPGSSHLWSLRLPLVVTAMLRGE
jgi:hypothetical protein